MVPPIGSVSLGLCLWTCVSCDYSSYSTNLAHPYVNPLRRPHTECDKVSRVQTRIFDRRSKIRVALDTEEHEVILGRRGVYLWASSGWLTWSASASLILLVSSSTLANNSGGITYLGFSGIPSHSFCVTILTFPLAKSG